MGRTLSTADLAQLEAASRALLSPLAFETEDDWCRSVVDAYRPVFGSDAGSFARPDRADGFFLGVGVDEDILQKLDWYLGPPNRFATGPDPVVNQFFESIIPSGIAMWVWETIAWVTGGMVEQSEFYQEVLVPGRMSHHHALFDMRATGGFHLVAHDAASHRQLSQEDATVRLQLLLPSFRAGLDTLERLKAHRLTLDAVGEPLAAFSADGVEIHRTPALRTLLAADPESHRVERGLLDLARRVRPLAFSLRADSHVIGTASDEVRTDHARYTLRATLLPSSGSGFGEAFLVTVGTTGGKTALPAPDDLRERHGLTRREAEVALLVAQGLSNDAIADRLFVSPHTVRHHVESTMSKLDLTGRGREAVAARLLGATAA